jgi:hypothetical protein
MNLGYPVREGRIVDDTPGDANLREAAMRRRNGGPGVVPGGVRKHNPRIIDVQREYTLESDCLRRFYEEMGGDEWVEHASWQKLLMQLRTPDGEPIELNRVANMSSSEITHFRNELDGLRSKWVDKKVLPPLLTRVVEIRMPSNNLVGPLPDCLSELTYLRHLVLPENRLTVSDDDDHDDKDDDHDSYDGDGNDDGARSDQGEREMAQSVLLLTMGISLTDDITND